MKHKAQNLVEYEKVNKGKINLSFLFISKIGKT